MEAHDKIFSIPFLKKFIKLIGNMNTIIKNVKLAELDIHIETAFFNTQTLKMI